MTITIEIGRNYECESKRHFLEDVNKRDKRVPELVKVWQILLVLKNGVRLDKRLSVLRTYTQDAELVKIQRDEPGSCSTSGARQ